MNPPNDEREDSDIVTDTRQTFHDLRGKLTIILSAVDRIREDAVSTEQETQLQRIESTASAVAEALTRMGKLLNSTLALTPATRLIWETNCLRARQIDSAVLSTTMSEIRAYYPLHQFNNIIVVAESMWLAMLRTAFGALNCHRVRITTSPTDVPYLLDAEGAELIAMAPPAGKDVDWWRTLRLLMQGYRHQPILLHLKEANMLATDA